MSYPFRCIRCSRPLQRGEEMQHYEGDAAEPFAVTCYPCGNYPLPPEPRTARYADELPEGA